MTMLERLVEVMSNQDGVIDPEGLGTSYIYIALIYNLEWYCGDRIHWQLVPSSVIALQLHLMQNYMLQRVV